MTSFTERTKNFLRTYGYWILFLAAIILVFRIVEHATVSGQVSSGGGIKTLGLGLLNDLIFTLSFCFFAAIPVFLLWLWKPVAARIFFSITGLLYLAIHAGLVRYYTTTKTLLGADLFGYSVADIKTTVSSSASFSITDLLPLLLLLLFVVGLYTIRKRSWQAPLPLTTALLVIGLLSSFAHNKVRGQQGTAAEYLSLNKTAYFLSANLQKQSYAAHKISLQGYPLMRPDNSVDALSPYFNLGAAKPNIVFLIIEGLGRDFTGPGAQYGGFTPFLDSLASHSLTWTNFLSTAGRSFAGLPSILGSLPYSQNGFNELGQNMPDHLSLISLLKKNGYRSNFFYGGNANFDFQDIFLERQGNDYILDENKFGTAYSRDFGDKYSWGYADGDLYKRSLDVLATQPQDPKLNIYFTLSTHEPFAVPNESYYQSLIDKKINSLPSDDKTKYGSYKEVWKALAYSDESIRSLLAGYAKRPDFANTIFIITGDHRLIPVQEQNSISRFHVPLLIYSPMLKQPASFKAMASHLDITPSLVQLLRRHADMAFPTNISWMGKGLDTGNTFKPGYEMPIMRNKNQLEDFIEGDVFLSASNLYRLKDGLTVEPLNNTPIKERLQAKLDSFRQLNTYLCKENKIFKDDNSALAKTANIVSFSAEEQELLTSISEGLTTADTLFLKAREFAFAGKYKEARLLCRKVLVESPNYHDVRVLYGRTHAWDKKYAVAAAAFKEVIRRDPTFEDAYLAWIDTEIWAGKTDSAALLVSQGLKALPKSAGLKEKKQKVQAAKTNPS